MTEEEILKGLYDETLVGNAPEVKDLTNAGLELGMNPESLLYDALIPSLEEVGARFERGDFFVPEMLIAARAMQGALDILRPLLAETGAKEIGTYVMGTVKGDVHDIGKNLVNIMLEGAGFTVHDLGVNVAPEVFVEKVQEHQPDIVGFSAFLTTTMPMFKANINALEKAGIRDDVIVMVGGAPVTQQYADAVGADGYAADASTAVRLAKDLIQRKRALVSACACTRGDRGGGLGGTERFPLAARRACGAARRAGRSRRDGSGRPRRGGGQEADLGLPDVRAVRAALDGDDLSDELPEDAAKRPLRRRTTRWDVRGQAGDAVRLGQGGRARAEDAVGARDRRPQAAGRQSLVGDVLLAELLQQARPAGTEGVACRGLRGHSPKDDSSSRRSSSPSTREASTPCASGSSRSKTTSTRRTRPTTPPRMHTHPRSRWRLR
jgi:5-methyltetrahydrofolate--homocysteine methyltransferase